MTGADCQPPPASPPCSPASAGGHRLRCDGCLWLAACTQKSDSCLLFVLANTTRNAHWFPYKSNKCCVRTLVCKRPKPHSPWKPQARVPSLPTPHGNRLLSNDSQNQRDPRGLRGHTWPWVLTAAQTLGHETPRLQAALCASVGTGQASHLPAAYSAGEAGRWSPKSRCPAAIGGAGLGWFCTRPKPAAGIQKAGGKTERHLPSWQAFFPAPPRHLLIPEGARSRSEDAQPAP